MGAKITKEEKTAIRHVNERIIAKVEMYRGSIEARSLKSVVLQSKKLVHKKQGEVLAQKDQLSTPFMLIEGTIQIQDFVRTRPGIFCAECFFDIASFYEIKASTECKLLMLNPKLRNLHLRPDMLEIFIRYVPIYPIAIHNPHVQKLLNITELEKKCRDTWWSLSIAASVLDRAVGLWQTDTQFDVQERPDFRDDIIEVMEYFNDVPKFISVPANSKPIVIQRTGEIPIYSWVLIAGTAQASDDAPDEADDIIADSDQVVILEQHVCMQLPIDSNYSIRPGSLACSIHRKTMLAVQFMKVFSMDASEAINAVVNSRIFHMKPGDRIEEDKWFKGIISWGKLSLIALPPGRASEFEKFRRTVIDQNRASTMSNRKSCRIATELTYGFEKCGEFDEFVAVQPTIGIITTGVEQEVSENPAKLSAIKESEEAFTISTGR